MYKILFIFSLFLVSCQYFSTSDRKSPVTNVSKELPAFSLDSLTIQSRWDTCKYLLSALNAANNYMDAIVKPMIFKDSILEVYTEDGFFPTAYLSKEACISSENVEMLKPYLKSAEDYQFFVNCFENKFLHHIHYDYNNKKLHSILFFLSVNRDISKVHFYIYNLKPTELPDYFQKKSILDTHWIYYHGTSY